MSNASNAEVRETLEALEAELVRRRVLTASGLRYALAYARYRLGGRKAKPSASDAWPLAQVEHIERIVDRTLKVDELEAEAPPGEDAETWKGTNVTGIGSRMRQATERASASDLEPPPAA